MIAVSVLCPRCGERLHRIVHEDCPPLSLQCVCGAAFPLAIEREPARDSFPHNFGEQYGAEDEHEAALNTELVQKMPREILEGAVSTTPARRLGEMEEVAHLIAFLASDRAGFINGEEIHIDGGIRLNTTSLGSRGEA